MDALYSKTPIHCDFLECVQCVKYVYTLHKDGKNVMKPNSAYPYKIINVIPVEEQLKDMGRETIDKTFCSDFFNQVLQDAAELCPMLHSLLMTPKVSTTTQLGVKSF